MDKLHVVSIDEHASEHSRLIAGVKYECIPISKLPDVIDRHMTVHEAEPEDAALDKGMTALEGVQLFVCCHGSRDSRCGSIGVPLARRLQTVADTVGLGDVLDVFTCSHIGGHKVNTLRSSNCISVHSVAQKVFFLAQCRSSAPSLMPCLLSLTVRQAPAPPSD